MRIGLETDNSGRKKCRYDKCDKDPKYVGNNGRILKGTTCAWISVQDAGGSSLGYYCRGCIDKIYSDLKRILDPKLWIFH